MNGWFGFEVDLSLFYLQLRFFFPSRSYHDLIQTHYYNVHMGVKDEKWNVQKGFYIHVQKAVENKCRKWNNAPFSFSVTAGSLRLHCKTLYDHEAMTAYLYFNLLDKVNHVSNFLFKVIQSVLSQFTVF